MKTFQLNGHDWLWREGGSLICLDPIVGPDGVDQTRWPTDLDVTQALKRTVRYLRRGQHPSFPEGIYEVQS